MKRFLFFTFFLLTFFSFFCKAQSVKLNAAFDAVTQTIKVDWNMIAHKTQTTYILLRSPDSKNWTEVVTDRVMQLYTDEDIFDYDDKSFKREIKNYYCLKIVDINENTVIYSNIVTVNTETGKRSWVIQTNPVSDELTLNYKGNEIIKGVINIAVYDFAGKTVIKFRSASIYRTIRIPVKNLRKGYYVVQVRVLNELMMNQKFLKQ